MPHAPEVRRTVTIVFTDVTGWTSLGDGMDPETLRHVMSRYFDEMRRVIERHGGRVEKYIGDAIMAVFGIPALREDDALRAVRAAAQMRDALDELNDELERDSGARIEIRTGVNTGEVVVGSNLDEILATGEPVTVAARLEQTAAPGEILIGDATHALVKDAVEVEDAGALDLKGKSAAVRAWRLKAVGSTAPGVARRLNSPLVGRSRELGLLQQALARTVAEGRCRVVTLVADAGVGKTRLAAEFVSGIEESVAIAQGRCPPYGEGVTFWPIAEVVRQLAGMGADDSGHHARAKIEALLVGDPDAASIAAHVAAVVGLTDVAYPVQETFWAIRRLLESIARDRPLVVAIDDVHWAEATLLDLVEYLCGWSTAVPILLLCSARPELLDARAGWGADDANASLIRLTTLTDDETHLVIANLVAGNAVDDSVRARISEIAEGNPLFVEEILRMAVDAGRLIREGDRWVAVSDLGSWEIPATVNALLDARLDEIPPDQRAILQRASVMGTVFSWTAIAELSPKDERRLVGTQLQALVRRSMIRPDRSDFPGDDGFAFSHVLVRDAAYRSVAKDTRADLHRRFAKWLIEKSEGAADPYDEIIGYHLEQAVRCRAELRPNGTPDRKLATKAARHLMIAGRRALARNDLNATIALLTRAIALVEADDPLWIEIAIDLGAALSDHGDPKRASELFAEAAARSEAHGDDRLSAHVKILRWFATQDTPAADLRQDAEWALEVFEAAGDDLGMSRALRALADVEYAVGRIAAREVLMEQALRHTVKTGDARELAEIQHTICVDLNLGPTHALEGIRRCEEMLAEDGVGRAITGSLFHALAHLRSMRGEFEDAMRLAESFREILKESGAMGSYWFFAEVPFNVKMLAEESQQAVDIIGEAYERLCELGDAEPMIAAMLSQGLYANGEYDEARVRAEEASAETAGWVLSSRQQARGVLAKVLARDGKSSEAEAMAREAVAFFEDTDFLIDHAVSLMDLGEVLDLCGRPAEAAASVHEAIGLYERKGAIAPAATARRVHERLAH